MTYLFYLVSVSFTPEITSLWNDQHGQEKCDQRNAKHDSKINNHLHHILLSALYASNVYASIISRRYHHYTRAWLPRRIRSSHFIDRHLSRACVSGSYLINAEFQRSNRESPSPYNLIIPCLQIVYTREGPASGAFHSMRHMCIPALCSPTISKNGGSAAADI